ncbi:MAG: hypothetical protein IIV53_10160, partial [Bacteroidaceae bacterium]|nr:hypothetical protein [Bacteroidaceae bacterium]
MFFCRKTHSSKLTAHNSPLKTASTVCKTTNLPSENQKVALSLGRSGRNRYFCNNKPLKKHKNMKKKLFTLIMMLISFSIQIFAQMRDY